MTLAFDAAKHIEECIAQRKQFTAMPPYITMSGSYASVDEKQMMNDLTEEERVALAGEPLSNGILQLCFWASAWVKHPLLGEEWILVYGANTFNADMAYDPDVVRVGDYAILLDGEGEYEIYKRVEQ